MKTLYVLVGVCMSLHAFAASADTPALIADGDSCYVRSIDDLDVREKFAAPHITPNAGIAIAPVTNNPIAIDPDVDDYTTVDIVPGINQIPQDDDDRTGSFAQPWTGDTE
jgi:hypothetical protein